MQNEKVAFYEYFQYQMTIPTSSHPIEEFLKLSLAGWNLFKLLVAIAIGRINLNRLSFTSRMTVSWVSFWYFDNDYLSTLIFKSSPLGSHFDWLFSEVWNSGLGKPSVSLTGLRRKCRNYKSSTPAWLLPTWDFRQWLRFVVLGLSILYKTLFSFKIIEILKIWDSNIYVIWGIKSTTTANVL